MKARKAEVAPVPNDVIADIVAKMAQENATTYRVADNAEIDWCPCCGINIRMNIDGKMFAKFICSPAIARQIGAKLIAIAHRAEAINSDPAILEKAIGDVVAAARKARST
ncbi:MULTISPECIES: hypothetical protein [unclassified Bradyrhizobium]|uniref:hypothetical protein n=1 Tax=unclassified Bradyrhizobium TaxID=2631580 RepID=UPI001FF9C97B|nr:MULTISPECIES: hypothetical protein [unclassified Bradyrhizobium]MCK1536825.1 hypothetical protein [Bradyrhizobium sp. 176]MCK1560128.1 hypothetical protein [Bradyrhizobium sp. 171]